MNKVYLSGFLSRDIEVRTTSNNKMVVSFTLACKRGKETTFLNCIAWEKTAEFISKYFNKGSYMIIPNGRLQVRNYEDRDGKRVYVTEVIVEEVEFGAKKKEQQQEVEPITDDDLNSELPF